MENSRLFRGLLKISVTIDSINSGIGNNVIWLVLLATLISASNAISRKVFSISSNAWLEVQWLLFGTVFMLSAPLVLKLGKHVRVDLIYRACTRKTQNWIDLLGHAAFLAPFCILMLIYGFPFAAKSIASNEQSINPGGLPLWPAKTLIPIGFTLLLAQSISEVIKCVEVIFQFKDTEDQEWIPNDEN